MSSYKAPTPGERIAAYRAAYMAANGRDIEVSFDQGWFRVGRPASKWRGAHLDECTATLKRRVASVDTIPEGRDAKQGSVRSNGSAVAVAPSDGQTP